MARSRLSSAVFAHRTAVLQAALSKAKRLDASMDLLVDHKRPPRQSKSYTLLLDSSSYMADRSKNEDDPSQKSQFRRSGNSSLRLPLPRSSHCCMHEAINSASQAGLYTSHPPLGRLPLQERFVPRAPLPTSPPRSSALQFRMLPFRLFAVS